MRLTRLSFNEAIPHLRTGDVAIYRVTRRFGLSWFIEKAISFWQNSPYIHVGIVCVQDGIPWIIDTSAFSGGREVLLQSDANDYSIDIYRINRETNTRLAISCGRTVSYLQRKKAGERTQFQVRISHVEEGSIARHAGDTKKPVYSIRQYTGLVYCASVPGSLLLTRFNGKIMWSGNSALK